MIVAFAQLNSLLEVNPLALANSSDPVFMLWDGMRNIANVALVGIFFFVIISQATSIGISNYGIKRMLPRLLSAAIFANLSFYVMAFIIDSFNLFGAGVGQLVIGVLQNTGLKGGDVEWTSVFGVSVLGLSAVGVLARGALPFLFGLLVIVALLVLATVIVLLLRQMVILVLVVFAAPLAVARALDGTRSLYDKAETLFIRLMIMYPVIVLVFASGKIVGLVLSAEFTLTTGSPAAQGVAKAVRLVLATLSAGLPLAILPFIFRATGGWTQKIYNGARNIGQTTERLRLGLAANLGTKTLGSEAWAAAHPRLSTIHQTPLDIISGNRLVRSRTAREAAYKTNLERHNALMSASGVMGRLTGNDVARVKGIKAVAAARAKDLEVAQTVFRHNVLAPAGVGDYDLLDGLTTYLRSPTPGNALVRGSKGQVDLRQYVGRRDFQQAAASMAGEYGEIGALMAMRARSPRGAQQNVTDAINAHSKTVGDSGGVFLQDPAYADRARARRSVANSYPDGSDGADAAGRADLQSLLDVKLLEEMVKRSPNRLVKSSSSYQEAVRDALLRAGNPSDPGYDQQLDEMLIQALGAPGGNGKGQVFTRSLLSALTSRDIAPESPNAALTNEILAILQSRYGGAPSGGTNPNLSPNAGPGGSPSPAGNGGGNNGPGGNAGAGPARGSKLYSPHEAAAQIAGLGLAVVSAQGVAGRLGIQTDQAQALVQDLLDRGFLEAAPGGGNFHQVAAGFDINNLPISVPPHEAGNRAAYQTMAGRREQAIQDLVAGTQSEDEIRGQIYQAAKQAAKTAGANPLQAVAAAIGATNAGMLAINQRVVLQQRAASTDLVDVQARAAAASAYAAAVAAGNVDPRERARQAAFDIYRKAGDSARGPKAEQMASAVSGAVPSGAPAPATPNTGQPSAVPPVPAAPQPILQRVPRPSSEDQYQIARQNTLRDGALSVSGIQRALRVSQSRAREIAREIIRREPERFAPGTQLVETPRTITQQGDQPIFKIEGDRSIPIIASRQEQDEARDAISKQRAAAGKANREASAANQVIIDQVVREVARRVFGSQPSGADEAAIEAALSGYDAALADNKLQEARRLASAAAEFSYGEDKVVAAGRDERIADALVNLYAARAAALPPPPPPVPAPQPAPEAQAVPNAAPAVAEPPRLVAQPPLTDEQRFIQQAEKEIKRLGLQKLSATGLAASLGLLPNGENVENLPVEERNYLDYILEEMVLRGKLAPPTVGSAPGVYSVPMQPATPPTPNPTNQPATPQNNATQPMPGQGEPNAAPTPAQAAAATPLPPTTTRINEGPQAKPAPAQASHAATAIPSTQTDYELFEKAKNLMANEASAISLSNAAIRLGADRSKTREIFDALIRDGIVVDDGGSGIFGTRQGVTGATRVVNPFAPARVAPPVSSSTAQPVPAAAPPALEGPLAGDINHSLEAIASASPADFLRVRDAVQRLLGEQVNLAAEELVRAKNAKNENPGNAALGEALKQAQDKIDALEGERAKIAAALAKRDAQMMPGGESVPPAPQPAQLSDAERKAQKDEQDKNDLERRKVEQFREQQRLARVQEYHVRRDDLSRSLSDDLAALHAAAEPTARADIFRKIRAIQENLVRLAHDESEQAERDLASDPSSEAYKQARAEATQELQSRLESQREWLEKSIQAMGPRENE